jgi:hypothetical protein
MEFYMCIDYGSLIFRYKKLFIQWHPIRSRISKGEFKKMIDDNVEKKPDAKKPKADVGKKTEHAKTSAEKAKASHKK